ncbi:hypothetical protein QNH48_17725 [Neobacillus sp. YX16]|uniref:hypothetical protein n=1 Tax=Neobacillus sp. YX16 TaxID=3047874 RepID=UPI0024C3257D|nr:hypothetical protein [Neobacillus sp. YX16]WHZ00881.1 hypothetical protein QNH48_17725 [Neobacillus sp. YX16]
MSVLYVVRCNFNDPETEEEWNKWYSTWKRDALLGVPGFRNVKRWRAVGLDKAVKYMATWEIDSLEVLQSEEYKAIWGWGKWRDNITDWTRTLYEEIPPGEE